MNNRLIGIIGASLIIAGVFLPIINLIIFTPSLFTVIVGSFPPALPRIPPEVGSVGGALRLIGIAVLLLGVGSLLLALKNQIKPLLGTGVVTLCLLVLIYIKVNSFLNILLTDAPPAAKAMVGMGMGLYVMALGAIGLIVAAVMKNPVPVASAGWNAPPPPPYTPGN
jgi:hypothetical protein